MTWLIDFITERPVLFARYVCYIAVAVAAVVGIIMRKKGKNIPFYDTFEKWLNTVLSKLDAESVVAFNFNIYEDKDDHWSIELVATSEFDENDSDWACAELFTSRETPYALIHKGTWKEVLSHYKNCVNKYLKSGEYREILKSKAAVGIGFVDGDITIIFKNQNFKMPESNKCFPYAKPMNLDMIIEATQAATAANNNFRFTNRKDHQKIIEQIDKKVLGILNGKPLPSAYQDIEDVAIDLGSRFAYAFNQARKWEWMMVGENEKTAQVSIVSPQHNYCIFPLTYMLGILKGEKENNVLLLWNMTENIDENPINKDDKKLTPLS